MDRDTGDLKWFFETGNRVRASLGVGLNNDLLVLSEDGVLYALEATTGEMSWSYETGVVSRNRMPKFSPIVDSDGTVYLGRYGGDLVAIDGSNGELLCEAPVGAFSGLIESPVLTANMIYAPSNNLYSVDSLVGEVISEFQRSAVAGSPPTLGPRGKVFAVGSNEILGAWEGSPDLVLQGLWPSFRGDHFNRGTRSLEPLTDDVSGDVEMRVRMTEEGRIELELLNEEEQEVRIETSRDLKEWILWGEVIVPGALEVPVGEGFGYFRVSQEIEP